MAVHLRGGGHTGHAPHGLATVVATASASASASGEDTGAVDELLVRRFESLDWRFE